MKNKKMDTKKLLVSFLAIVCVFSLVAIVSAAELANDVDVKVDGIFTEGNDVSVIAGETIDVKVYFTALVGDGEHDGEGANVRIKAELEGEKVDVSDRTETFDVEAGKRYSKTLTLQVPYELKDEVSDDLDLTIKIWNGDHETEVEGLALRVQRPSYNADIKSVSVSNTVEAGETFPVDIVIKNRGYNDLDDVYVTVGISALGVQKSAYFGDLVVEENDNDDDDTDTVSGRLYLEVPYDVKAGVYTLDVKVVNDDTVSTTVKQIVIENDLSNTIVTGDLKKTVAVGETAEYTLLVVNPTDKLKVYGIVSESSNGVLTVATPSVIAIPAGSSGTVKVTATADAEGQYVFTVGVVSGETIVDAVTFNLGVEGTKAKATNPVVVLTIVLAIVFLVLLVVLIVLLGKKPEKAEEFGESYY
ncbi:hypothetical protein J4474_01580 [Candidatus Pacearchaeota archaeon]|nr:hypothetical protein [Candidatus Pacearchaeota archaeon]